MLPQPRALPLGSAWGARSGGIAQVLLGCRLFAQLSETSVTKFLLHALPELVRLAKETPGPSLLGAFALVIHVRVRVVPHYVKATSARAQKT